MAGGRGGAPVGQIFVEIDLDRSKYDKALQNMLSSTEGKIVTSERAFKNLGVKTDETFTRMKANAVKSFEAIAQSGTASANEIRRAQEAMNKKLAALNEKQFGKQLSLMDKMKANWIALTASAAGFIIVLSQVQNGLIAITQAGVDMQRIKISMESALGSASAAGDALAYVRGESNRLGLSFQEQSRSFTKLAAAAKGTALEGQGVRDIFTAVAEAATALQMSTDDANGSLIAISQMISKGKVSAEELRQQLGERLPGAFNIAAKAMGVTTAELDNMLKKGEIISEDFIPRFASALRDQYSGSIEQASQSTSAEIERMKTAYFDLKVAMADTFGDTTVSAIRSVTSALREMKEIIPLIANAVSFLDQRFGALGEKFKALNAARDNISAVISGKRDWNTGEYLRPTSGTTMPMNVEGYRAAKSLDEMISGLGETTAKYGQSGSSVKKSLSDAGKAANKAAEEIKRLVEQADKFIRKASEEVELAGLTGLRAALRQNEIEYENTLKTFAGLKGAKLDEATASALAVKNMKDEAAVLRETNDQRQKAVNAAKEQAQHERDMAELARQNAEKYGTFAEGWVVGLKEFQENAITTFKAGSDAVASLAGAMSSTMSTMFFDVITGRFESLRDAFKSFGDSILRIFTDMLAQMAVKSMMSGLGGLFGGAGLLGGLFGGGATAAAGSTFGASSLGGVFSSGLLFHGGGVVGSGGQQSRAVDPFIFANAPRYHRGLFPDEVPAILQKGETVLPKGTSLSGGESGGSTYNINIMAMDSKSIHETLARNPSALIGPITKALKQNQMNRTWKELLK